MTTKRRTSSRTLLRQGAFAALIAAGLLVISGSLAGCALSQTVKKETNFTGREIAAHRLKGRALRSNPIVQRFLDNQVTLGRDLGLEGVRAAKLGAVTIVWEAGVKIDRVGVVGDGDGGGIGVTQHEEHGGPATLSPPFGTTNGLRNVKGATETGTACTMIAAYGNRATSCFEKWRIRDTTKTNDYYVYDRWGAAEPGSGSGATEVTIRSRQRRGTEGSIASLLDYWPGAGGKVCDLAKGTGSIQLGRLADFSATFPIASCAATDMSVNARDFSMMSQWKGQGAGAGAAATRSSQFYVTLRTWQGKAPEMADYIWTSFTRSHGGSGGSVTWRKSGWSPA